MENLKKLKKDLDSEAGKSLKEFLLSHYLKLKSIDNIKDCDTIEGQALEIRATKKALSILENILSEIITLTSVEDKGSEEDYQV